MSLHLLLLINKCFYLRLRFFMNFFYAKNQTSFTFNKKVINLKVISDLLISIHFWVLMENKLILNCFDFSACILSIHPLVFVHFTHRTKHTRYDTVYAQQICCSWGLEPPKPIIDVGVKWVSRFQAPTVPLYIGAGHRQNACLMALRVSVGVSSHAFVCTYCTDGCMCQGLSNASWLAGTPMQGICKQTQGNRSSSIELGMHI